jgi:DNA-binding helix-hairpin-helix protein with protein kinase domain
MLAALPMAGVGMVGMLAVGVPTIAASILLVLLWGMVSVAICIAAYRREPAVRRVLPLVRREIHALRGIAAAERAARDIAAKREVTLRQLSRDREDASKRSGELQQQEKRKLDALLESLTAKLETIDRRIYDVDRREVEQTELALQELQQRHIGEALRRASLRTASIPGVGPAVKMRLWALGVWAAADVSSDRIGSMQHLKHEHVMEVVAWRVGTETGARRTMPRELPIALKGPLHERYARERLNFVAKRSEEEAIVHGAMAEVRDTFAQRHAWAEERLTERLREGAAMLARLEDQLIRVGAEQQAQQSLLEAVRLEIAECEGVSFQQFLRSIFRLRIREKSA